MLCRTLVVWSGQTSVIIELGSTIFAVVHEFCAEMVDNWQKVFFLDGSILVCCWWWVIVLRWLDTSLQSDTIYVLVCFDTSILWNLCYYGMLWWLDTGSQEGLNYCAVLIILQTGSFFREKKTVKNKHFFGQKTGISRIFQEKKRVLRRFSFSLHSWVFFSAFISSGQENLLN